MRLGSYPVRGVASARRPNSIADGVVVVRVGFHVDVDMAETVGNLGEGVYVPNEEILEESMFRSDMTDENDYGEQS